MCQEVGCCAEAEDGHLGTGSHSLLERSVVDQGQRAEGASEGREGCFLCRRRSGSSDIRIASVPFESDGLALVRWLTRCHNASVVKPIEKQNKSVKRRRRETP